MGVSTFTNIIQTEKLVTGYGEGKNFIPVPGFQINLTAGKGELIALIGTNGSGKTTLLKTLSGLKTYKSGMLQICGLNPQNTSQIEFAKCLSIGTTEPIRIAYTTVFDFVSLGRFPYLNLFGKLSANDLDIINQAILETGIEIKRNALLNTLSDGERQRAVIARTLAQDTPLILLDEPTAYLDIPNKYEILTMLKSLTQKYNKTILFSTHDLTAALNLADTIWLLTKNEIIKKIPEQMLLDGDLSSEFNSNHVQFDNETINFIFQNNTTQSISIQGNGIIEKLTRKALVRIGFDISSNKSCQLNVIIETKNNKPCWKLMNQNTCDEFNQLDELILHLKYKLNT